MESIFDYRKFYLIFVLVGSFWNSTSTPLQATILGQGWFAVGARPVNSGIEKVSRIPTELKFIVCKPQSSYMSEIPGGNEFSLEIQLSNLKEESCDLTKVFGYQ